MATPGGPRPGGFPPNYNPDSLASNIQNLNINQPNQQQWSNAGGSGAPTNSGASPFGQPPPPFAAGQSRPPPPGVFPRGWAPNMDPRQSTSSPPDVMSARPTGPTPVSQPPPFASRPPPSGVLPPSVGRPSAPPNGAAGFRPQMTSNGNGSPSYIPDGIVAPPPMGSVGPRPSVGPAQPPTMMPSSQPLQTRPGLGSPHAAESSSASPPFSAHPQGPPFSGPPQRMPPPPGSLPFPPPPRGAVPSSAHPQGPLFSGPPQSMPPSPGSLPFPPPPRGAVPSSGNLYGMQTWPQHPQQAGSPPFPGAMQQQQQQQQMFGLPPGPQPLPNNYMALGQTGQAKVDHNQIPRFSSSSALILHETRINDRANPPPPATSNYVVKDTGNCSPRYMRCTLNQVPCTADLLSTSAMQLALLVQPLALPHPDEEPIQVVDFGESGPVRCSRCKGYINPFMKFIDQGRRFVCNLCGFTDETPHDYQCNLGPDGRRRDAYERPELCKGTVEFVASKEYMLRDPMPAVFFFLVDVSMHAIKTGATAAACSAISQVIPDLPGGPRTMVGIATFDSSIHFYSLKRALQQPLMLIVPDVQDVYTPLESDVVVKLAECRQHLEILLESIPTMFENTRINDSAFGAAAKAAFLAMKNTGGKLLVFQSILPSTGIGSLSAREAEGRSNITSGEKDAHKLLQPVDKTLKTMAMEFAEYQVCVDLFITTQTYIDIASLAVVPQTTGGQLYYYYPFSALSDPAKLFNDLRWNVTRPQGFEAVMRVRCSQGIQVQEYTGNFCKRIPTDVDLPAIDCDKTIMVSLKLDDKLQEESECSFQCATLYTTVYGQRRIRISTVSLPCTNTMSNLFVAADLDTQFSCILKHAANEMPSTPLAKVRDQATNLCIDILHSYSKSCATRSSGHLLLPEALKFLPLYTLALLKSSGLRSDGRIDDISFWLNYVSPLPIPFVIPLVYPRMIALHDLDQKELEESIIPDTIPLSSKFISDEGIYLLENGLECLVYVGNSVQRNFLEQFFGISSVEEISDQFILQQYDNPLSKKLNAILNEIRHQRCSYLRLKFCKNGDSSGSMFLSYMVEDNMPSGAAYPDFIVYIHNQIRKKTT